MVQYYFEHVATSSTAMEWPLRFKEYWFGDTKVLTVPNKPYSLSRENRSAIMRKMGGNTCIYFFICFIPSLINTQNFKKHGHFQLDWIIKYSDLLIRTEALFWLEVLRSSTLSAGKKHLQLKSISVKKQKPSKVCICAFDTACIQSQQNNY